VTLETSLERESHVVVDQENGGSFYMARQGNNTVSAFVTSSDTNVGELHDCPHVRGWVPLMTVHTNIRNVSKNPIVHFIIQLAISTLKTTCSKFLFLIRCQWTHVHFIIQLAISTLKMTCSKFLFLKRCQWTQRNILDH
jgi:hypothetical protein